MNLQEEFEAAVHALPRRCILLAGPSTLDKAVAKRIQEVREDIELRSVEYTWRAHFGLKRWINEHVNSLYLTSTAQAFVLMHAEQMLLEGRSVALIGPVPVLKDNFWQLSDGPEGFRFAASSSRWTVVDYAKNIAPFLLQRRFKCFTPGLIFEGGIFLAYLKALDLLNNESLYRTLGVRELIKGEAFARMLVPDGFEKSGHWHRPPDMSVIPAIRKWQACKIPVGRYLKSAATWELGVDQTSLI